MPDPNEQTAPDTTAAAPDANPGQAAAAPAPAPETQPGVQPADTSAGVTSPMSARSAAPIPSATSASVPNVNDAGAPTAPTAQVSAGEDAAISSGHGSAGKILRGALLGVLKGAGTVAKDIALSTHIGQELQANQIARTGAKQEQQLAKNKDAREATTAKEATTEHNDMHLKTQVETNNLSLAGVHSALENSKLSREERTANNAEADGIRASLAAAGIKLKDEHGAGFDNMGQSHAQGIANGDHVAIQNGKTGPDHGVVFANVDQLKATPIAEPYKYASDFAWDDKKNDAVPTAYSTIPADGTHTAYEAMQAYGNGQARMANMRREHANQDAQAKAQADAKVAQMAPAEKQAEITSKNATANKENADATKARAEAVALAGGINDNNKNLRGEEFIKTLPAAMQDMVRGYTSYQLGPNTLPRGKEKLPFMEAVLHADPTFDDKKYEERYKYIQQYGSSTNGDGATRRRIATAAQHLALSTSPDIDKALAQHDVNFLNKIANAVGVASGSDADLVYNAIVDKAAGETAGAVKGGAGSATDPGIEKSLQSFKSEHAPQQRRDIAKGLFMILNSQGHTIDGAFTTTMGKTPEAYGQPVLPADIQKTIDEGIQTGTSNAVPTGGGQAAVQKTAPTPQTHEFNVAGWQAAHPGQDPSTVIKFAQQQGYTVKQ